MSTEKSRPAKTAFPPLSHGPQDLLVAAATRGELDGLIVTSFENEKPSHGLFTALDFLSRGSLFQSQRAGFLSGKTGEHVLAGVKLAGKGFPVLVIGLGPISQYGVRPELSESDLKKVSEKLKTLGWKKVGLVPADFGASHASGESFRKSWKDVTLWTN